MKKKSRLTLDMTPEQHACLKMASAHFSIPMRKLLLLAVFEKLQSLSDEWLSKKVEETLKEIGSLPQTPEED